MRKTIKFFLSFVSLLMLFGMQVCVLPNNQIDSQNIKTIYANEVVWENTELVLNRDSLNRILSHVSADSSLKEYGTKLYCKNDSIYFEANVPMLGKKIPAKLSGKLVVTANQKFSLKIKEISFSKMNLPRKQLLQMFAKFVKLPSGLEINVKEESIIFDLNLLLPKQKGLTYLAKESNLQKNRLIIQMKYNPKEYDPFGLE